MRRYSVMLEGKVWRKYHGLYASVMNVKGFSLSDCKYKTKGIFFEFSFLCDRKSFERFESVIKGIQLSLGLTFRRVDNLTSGIDTGEVSVYEFQYILIKLSTKEMVKITPERCYLPDERVEEGKACILKCTVGRELILAFRTPNNMVIINLEGLVIQILGCEKK